MLECLLGSGSFSSVCQALDTLTGEKVWGHHVSCQMSPGSPGCKLGSRCLMPVNHAMQVAIKRVADVLSSPDQAKRALREICILRRMRHPNIIGLRDAFSKPSSTGAARGACCAPVRRVHTCREACKCWHCEHAALAGQQRQ